MNIFGFQSVPDWQVVYVLTALLAVLILAALSAFTWRFRYSELGQPFLLMTLSGFGWSILVLLQAIFPPELGRFWLNLRQIFAATCPITLIWYVLQITGLMPPWRTKLFWLLSVVPAIGLLLLWTESNHGWMVSEVSFSRIGILTYVDHISFGPYFWLVVGQGYLLTSISFAVLLASSFHATPLMRNQTLPVAIGIAAPLLTNFLLLTQIVSRKYDPMPYGMAFMACTVWWATLRYKLLDLIPLARNVMVDAMVDSVMVVDSKGRIIDVNLAMSGLIGLPLATVLGRPVSELFVRFETAEQPDADRMLLSNLLLKDDTVEDATPIRIHDRWLIPKIIKLPSRDNMVAGRLLVFHDVTERIRIEAERQTSLVELKDALGQVRNLRGLLPICASCKKIKDKIGCWRPVEEYIRENSEADLSHGVCPDCQSRLYSHYLG